MPYDQKKTKNKDLCNGRVEIKIKKVTKNVKFSNLASTFMYYQGAKNSFDMGLGGPKDDVIGFLCKSDDFFY